MSKFIALISLAFAYSSLSNVAVNGQYSLIADFLPVTNIVQESLLDLDQKNIEATMASTKTDAALAGLYNGIYTTGQNAQKSANNTALQSLKAAATTDLSTQFKQGSIFLMYSGYWKNVNYADDFVSKAFLGTGDFSGKDINVRIESAQKGIAYQNIWINVVSLLDNAKVECNAGNYDSSIASLERAWARYSGSQEGVDGSSGGFFLYSLAEKRCLNFGTCSDGRRAKINGEILSLFEFGRVLIKQKVCDKLTEVIDRFVSFSAVPKIQGVIRYAYFADPLGGYTGSLTGGKKEWAEGWAFLASVLPQIAKCDADVATNLRNNLDITAAAPMKDGHVAFKKSIEKVYSCLKISCKQVGALTAVANSEACTDSSDATFPPIAGYSPSSDVSKHSYIDRDLAEISTLIAASKFTEAKTIYTNGKNSAKSSSMRTLQKFSTEHKDLGDKDFALYQTYAKYWKSATFADDFVQKAFGGEGEFSGKDPSVRIESIQKVIAYQNVWMKVFEELYDALIDCKAGSLELNDMGVTSWDEAWAFYAGSLENGKGSGNLLFSLAVKRCKDFGTCTPSGLAMINVKILAEFEKGRSLLQGGDCDTASKVVDGIVKLATVPLIQGALRYAYRADPKAGFATTTKFQKEQAEDMHFFIQFFHKLMLVIKELPLL